MVTADSGWGTLKLYKVKKKQLIEIVKTDKPFHFWQAMTVLLQICRDLQNLTKLGLQWRKTKNQIE